MVSIDASTNVRGANNLQRGTYGVGWERRSYALLRPFSEPRAQNGVRDLIIGAYEEHERDHPRRCEDVRLHRGQRRARRLQARHRVSQTPTTRRSRSASSPDTGRSADNLAFPGEFSAATPKHFKALEKDLPDVLSVAVDRGQRAYEPMTAQVDAWKNHSLTDARVKESVYDAFVRKAVDGSKHLTREVDSNHFEPRLEECRPRTLYSRQNAFTSAFQKLDPMPMYRGYKFRRRVLRRN